MSKRGTKKDAWKKEFVQTPIGRHVAVGSVIGDISTAKNKLRFASSTLRELKKNDLADSCRRLSAEIDHLERRVNASFDADKNAWKLAP